MEMALDQARYEDAARGVDVFLGSGGDAGFDLDDLAPVHADVGELG